MSKGELYFSENIKNDFIDFCRRNHWEHLVFICDVNTEKYCLPFFEENDQVIVIPSGELSKGLDTYSLIIKKIIHFKAGKSTLIVNLGGGMVTDIGGFAASTYMRGIDFVNIPTSLLGMVDAAIGGKTGIDFLNHKNYLGTFALPEMVLIWPGFLETLPETELLAGTAEIIKTGIIANRLLFDKIVKGEPILNLISMTATTKKNIVELDFKDKGQRQLLNFGHTIGHAFESYRLNIDQPVLHGFAVAKGMMAEARIANSISLIATEDMNLMIDCIAINTRQSELNREEFDAVKDLLFMDKKNFGEAIIFSLPNSIGSGKIKVPVSLEVIQKSLFHA